MKINQYFFAWMKPRVMVLFILSINDAETKEISLRLTT